MADVRAYKERQGGGRAPYVLALVAATVGVGFAGYLLHVHRLAHEMGTGFAACDFGEGIGCSAVALDEWATVLGVPTAAWGLLTYVAFAALAWAGIRRGAFPRGPAGMLFWGSIPCLFFGLFLVWVMATRIHELCVFCLGLDAVHVVLFAAGLWAIRGRGPKAALTDDLEALARNRPLLAAVVGGPLVAALLVFVVYPRGEAGSSPNRPDGSPPELPDAGMMREAPSTEGVPCLGPEDAIVTILEFSDYQCPYCRRAHHEVRRVAERLQGQVRFCHYHHPLDQACNPRITRPFHPAACLGAAAAICAHDQGHFWEMNDLLFRNARALDPGTVARLARGLDLDGDRFASCLESDRTADRINLELSLSRGIPVEGTPTFVVNGRIIPGALPADDFEALVRSVIDNDGQWPRPSNRNRDEAAE